MSISNLFFKKILFTQFKKTNYTNGMHVITFMSSTTRKLLHFEGLRRWQSIGNLIY